MVHVALITNADLVVYGIQEILTKADGILLVGTEHDLLGCGKLAQQKSPHVIIVDAQSIATPKATQIKETVENFKQLSKRISFISLTDWTNESRFEFARQLGFKGFCLKTISSNELIEAIKTVAQGKIYIHAAYAEQSKEQGNGTSYSDLLGARQQEILSLLLYGHTNREIADILFLSPETVKSHIKVILKKLKVRDRTQAVSLVFREMVDYTSLQSLDYTARASNISSPTPKGNEPPSYRLKRQSTS